MGSVVRISLLLIIFAAGFTTGCSGFSTDQDGVLTSYVEDYARVMHIDIDEFDGFSVTFSTLKKPNKSGTIGRCYPLINKIEVDPNYWYKETVEIEKKALMFHELTHCYSGFPHDNEMLGDGCPASLMHESDNQIRCLKKHWKLYMKDLRVKNKEMHFLNLF